MSTYLEMLSSQLVTVGMNQAKVRDLLLDCRGFGKQRGDLAGQLWQARRNGHGDDESVSAASVGTRTWAAALWSPPAGY